MEEDIRSIAWEGPEHSHSRKSSDWYWALAIIAITGAIVAIILDNLLFGLVIILGAAVMIIVSQREPKILEYEISQRCVRVGSTIYPYASLDRYYLDETNTVNPQVLFRSKHLLTPLIIFPVPVEYVDEIETLISAKLPEVEIEEPVSHRILEVLGF